MVPQKEYLYKIPLLAIHGQSGLKTEKTKPRSIL